VTEPNLDSIRVVESSLQSGIEAASAPNAPFGRLAAATPPAPLCERKDESQKQEKPENPVGVSSFSAKTGKDKSKTNPGYRYAPPAALAEGCNCGMRGQLAHVHKVGCPVYISHYGDSAKAAAASSLGTVDDL
jgi:hypothetical protein